MDPILRDFDIWDAEQQSLSDEDEQRDPELESMLEPWVEAEEM